MIISEVQMYYMQDQLVRVSSVNGQRALQHNGQQVLNSPQSSLKEHYGYTLGWPHWRWKIFRSLEDQEKRDLVGKTGTKAQCPHHVIASGGYGIQEEWSPGRTSSQVYNPNHQLGIQGKTPPTPLDRWTLPTRKTSWSEVSRSGYVSTGAIHGVTDSWQLSCLCCRSVRANSTDKNRQIKDKVCGNTLNQYMSPLLPLKSLWLPSAFKHLSGDLFCPSLTQEGCLSWLFSVLSGRCFSSALLAYWICHSFIHHRFTGIYFTHWLLISNSLTFFGQIASD